MDNRRQPLIVPERRRVGEVAGGTAAECAAVCCCCPLTVMNVVVMVVYKVPTGLCKKAKRRRREKALEKRRTIKKGLLEPARDSSVESFGGGVALDGGAEEEEFEAEMWDRFYGTGFWRSPSQRNVGEEDETPQLLR